ncbi:MAG TPA: ADP-forming succinate--CoA ligase subunit beta [Verrucomicrobiae bacterium]|nr:ADP-forming succinate--CoA ligase subunit beta [Verrucomicrobiae bacterium]
MNIHEYQAQELLNRFEVPTPRGKAASTADEAEAAARWLGVNTMVVKAQIHAGGRGKGTFKSGLKGGVQLCKTTAQVREIAGQMLGQVLVTKQTGAEGRLVRKVMVAEAKEIERELYVAILLDRARGCPMLLASIHGGMDIEAVAEEHPDSIVRESIHPALGLQPYQTRKIARRLGFPASQTRAACSLLHSLYQAFIKLDCNLVEINPLVVTKGGEVLALDAKFGFDDNALFRHPEVVELRDVNEEDPREVEASKIGLNYIGLDGDIGCMVNGAGLAMSTMDIIKFYGGNPANFLDVGGGADEEQVTGAFKILLADKRTKAVLVNIFGGIMKCDVIAQGIINAAKAVGMKVPLVVRLEGTNVEEGRRMLKESGLALQAATDLADAARRAVEAAKGA